MRRSLLSSWCCAVLVLLSTLGGTSTAAAAAMPRVAIDDASGATLRAIRGAVVDATGAPVSGAEVVLNAGRPSERTTVTDGAGRFAFDNVPAGVLTITASLDRFAPATVDVNADAASEVRVVLTPLPVSEQITVHAPKLTESHITTATKTDTPLRDVPQSVTIVTRDLITDQSMQSMGDVVRYVPGIGMAQGEGNRDTPVFRGNSSTSDFYVDGVRDDTQYFRDLYNVERVEAFKGPNAMIFGRGGVGGVINRVSRQANWAPIREVSLEGGSWDHRRMTGDLGQGVTPTMAVRLTGVYEDSNSYRRGVGIERYGVNPTMTVTLGMNTTLRAGYELFHDDRTADRGVPSFNGRPLATDASTFFGDADRSHGDVTVHALSSVLEHSFGGRLTLRNRVSYADYDKFYQNVFPGAVNAAGTAVSLSAYNNATQRQNLFNQTDVIASRQTGRIDHTLLAGVELGRQVTDNFRNTGYFSSISPTASSVSVPLDNPTTLLPIEFRQSATDADNHSVATVAALYAQDQITLSQQIQAVLGLRYDRFQVDFRNHRTAIDLASEDGLVSPRLGLVYKPREPVSIYASYSVSYLPRAGEQLSSLSPTNQAFDPEKFQNYEIGTKWDLRPGLALSAAVYRLDRGNVVVPHPDDPAVSLLVDGQRSKGVELGLSGNITRAWSVMGAYAYQDGEITRTQSATVLAGARLAQLPEHTFSLWNKYEITRMWSAGLGVIHRGDIFTSTDNTVIVPSFTRVDAAVYARLTPRLRLQVNVENLFDESYFVSAHSNNNITPGSPRAVRVALTTRF